MSRGRIIALSLLFALVATPFALNVVLLEGLEGLLMGFDGGWDPPTRYAPGYSDAHFRRVRAGMRHEDVLSLLGEPLFKVQPDGLRSGCYEWFYSWKKESRTWHSR